MTESDVSSGGENKKTSQGFLYDTALRQPDQDRLGRSEFARFLAKAILGMDAEEGFVFALNGPWGAGKTTIINFVLHFLTEESKNKNELVVVRFNPWWFSGREQLIQQFFRQFKVALGGQDAPKELKNVSQKLDRFARILEPLTLVPAVGGWIERHKNVFRTSATATQAIAEALAEDIHKLRASIDSTLRNQTARILVVIDDIDRLHPEEIGQLFQVVKAVADFPKTIYLLAFDREAVTGAVSKLQSASGDDYLEKIVQAPFDLPIPDRTSLRRLLFEQIDEVLTGTPEGLWDAVEWGNLYWGSIDLFIQTSRDVKRFINVLRPTYAIVKGEVNPVDFIGVQALRLFVPEMYSFVISNKDVLTGVENSGLAEERPESRRKFFDSFLEGASGDRRKAIMDTMTRLFPRWAWAYGGSTYGAEWLSIWRKKLRICSPDVCDRYFLLSLPPGDLSSMEMQALLSLGSDPNAFAKELLRLSTDVITIAQEHGKYGEREPTQAENQRTVSASDLPELEAIALQKIRESANAKRLHLAPRFGYLLYHLGDWSSEDEAKAYVSELIVDDIGVCDYLSGFFQFGYSHGFSDRVAKRAGRIHLPSVQKFLGAEPSELVPRCEGILKDSPSWLNQRRKQALETFVNELKEPLDEWGRPKRGS